MTPMSDRTMPRATVAAADRFDGSAGDTETTVR
jgi:hypothetical protein